MLVELAIKRTGVEAHVLVELKRRAHALGRETSVRQRMSRTPACAQKLNRMPLRAAARWPSIGPTTRQMRF